MISPTARQTLTICLVPVAALASAAKFCVAYGGALLALNPEMKGLAMQAFQNSMLDYAADSLALNPFVTFAVIFALALALCALAAVVVPAILDGDSMLPQRARAELMHARRETARRNHDARARPAIWRRQVKAEGETYLRALSAQLRAENS